MMTSTTTTAIGVMITTYNRSPDKSGQMKHKIWK